MTRIELKSGHTLVWQVETMDDTIIAQVPNLDEAVGAASSHPFVIRTLPDRIDLLSVLAECSDTRLLSMVPDAHFGVSTAREEYCVSC